MPTPDPKKEEHVHVFRVGVSAVHMRSCVERGEQVESDGVCECGARAKIEVKPLR